MCISRHATHVAATQRWSDWVVVVVVVLAVVLADILGLPPPSLISLSLTSLYFSQLASLLPALGWPERQKHTTICDTLSSNMILNSPGFLGYHFLIISVHLVLQCQDRPPSCT